MCRSLNPIKQNREYNLAVPYWGGGLRASAPLAPADFFNYFFLNKKSMTTAKFLKERGMAHIFRRQFWTMNPEWRKMLEP